MTSPEKVNVCRCLKDKEIYLSPNNTWLKSCINWYKSHAEIKDTYKSIHDYVSIQWLLSDLQDVQHSCLPTNCTARKTELSGKYCVQINWMRDIGQSCYSQLQAAQNVKELESNDYVSADEPKKQSWEPNPKRVLMMEVTDGVTTLKAMEYSPIPKLDEQFLPGLKILLSGPIECRNGILFLKNNNVSILGGEVDHLHEIYSKENLLSKCLNIPVSNKNDHLQERLPSVSRVTNDDCSPLRPSDVDEPLNSLNHMTSLYVSPVMSNLDQVPDSTSTIEQNMYVEDRDMLISDDDDDFLQLPLPDEILNGADNFLPEPSNRTSAKNDISYAFRNTKAVQNSEICNDQSRFYNHPVLNKPKLFPSLEDLRVTEPKKTAHKIHVNESPPKQKISFLSNQQNSHSNVLQETPSKIYRSESRQKTISDESLPSSTSLNSVFTKHLVESKAVVEHEKIKTSAHLNKSDEDPTKETTSVADENQYPKQKLIEGRVECITKIKIKSSQWQCCADIDAGGHSISVCFSSKVLDKVFGISASEVEILRLEMVGDDSLKKKVNQVLKDGQAKLKTLRCPMTLEYSSENCIPQVISVDVT